VSREKKGERKRKRALSSILSLKLGNKWKEKKGKKKKKEKAENADLLPAFP